MAAPDTQAGDMTRELLFDRALRFYEFEAVEQYLRPKWGLNGGRSEAGEDYLASMFGAGPPRCWPRFAVAL